MEGESGEQVGGGISVSNTFIYPKAKVAQYIDHRMNIKKVFG